MRYYPVIDAVRFLAALCVVLHHGINRPLSAAATGMPWLPDALGSIWFGRSAVVVFFVVSGFCVHGPHVGTGPLDKRAFWIRRYVRILVPLAVILPVAEALNVSYAPYGGWVTWTILCEVAYYTAYPALRAAAGRIGWWPLIAAGYLVGYGALFLWSFTGSDSFAIQAARDVLSNSPAWLLGCWIAEAVREQRGDSFPSVFFWRPLILGASFSLGLAHYTGFASLEWTFPIFGLLAAMWLLSEVSRNAPFRLLAPAGAWSYSLYLVHPAALHGLAPALYALLPVQVAHVANVAAACAVSYLFYLAVERPSHALARIMSRPVKRSPAAVRSQPY